MDSKNQDNQLYYIDIIIFRVTCTKKNPRNFPHKWNMKNRQKEEAARVVDGRLQPVLKATYKNTFPVNTTALLVYKIPWNKLGGGGVVHSDSVLAFQFISITRSLPPSSLCPD